MYQYEYRYGRWSFLVQTVEERDFVDYFSPVSRSRLVFGRIQIFTVLFYSPHLMHGKHCTNFANNHGDITRLRPGPR
jgi:hypothetical protein